MEKSLPNRRCDTPSPKLYDIVKLNSGGPDMLIIKECLAEKESFGDVPLATICTCAWVDAYNNLYKAKFNKACLTFIRKTI